MSRAYRHRVRLIRDQSADGSNVADYQTIGSGYPCKITPKTAYESVRGNQLEAGVSHVIEMRYYCNFLPNDILENEYTGNRYDIKGVINVMELSREMELHVNQVVV